MKKINLKGNNITATYIEHKQKNTGNTVLIHPQNVENSTTKTFFWTFC